MENNIFAPGTILSTITSRSGREVIFRTPTNEDLDELTDYINELSREDIYVTVSGEVISRQEEKRYLDGVLVKMAKHNLIQVLAVVGDRVVGNARVEREGNRAKHVGIIGIGLREQYRSDGIGTAYLQLLIDLAHHMNITHLELAVYHPNTHAKHLYQKLGFHEVGRIPERVLYRGKLIDEIIMTKKLYA